MMLEKNSTKASQNENHESSSLPTAGGEWQNPSCGPPSAAMGRSQKLFSVNWPFPTVLQLGLPAIAGICCGLAVWVAIISEASSYLSDSPQTCVNCHVMRSAYAGWQHSSHREVATCNDCHVPHGNFFHQWAFKARDGLWHATVFTFRWEPQVIQLSSRAIPVVQENCRRCHASQISETHLVNQTDSARRCWDCHASPHGEVQSLSTLVQWLLPAE
jgi:cytochrome c nitrite reductase small subunit